MWTCDGGGEGASGGLVVWRRQRYANGTAAAMVCAIAVIRQDVGRGCVRLHILF